VARKTRKANEGDVAALFGLFGVVLLIPFLVISFVTFRGLRQKYLESPTAQRVMDIKRLGSPLLCISVGMGLCVFIALALFAQKTVPHALLGVLLTIPVLCIGYIMAKYLAVLYLGIVADKDKNSLFFPHDLQSYTLTDYFSLRFLKDLGRVDSVNLSAIQKMTRGRGKELYVHGGFGSRGIIMSSKQKRDECLTMIQSLSGKKGLLIVEVEGY
jgi:hypothetical protein